VVPESIAKSARASIMNNLAMLYQEGKGVGKYEKEHLRLLRQFIRGGQIQPEMNTGLAYFRGYGVPV